MSMIKPSPNRQKKVDQLPISKPHLDLKYNPTHPFQIPVMAPHGLGYFPALSLALLLRIVAILFDTVGLCLTLYPSGKVVPDASPPYILLCIIGSYTSSTYELRAKLCRKSETFSLSRMELDLLA